MIEQPAPTSPRRILYATLLALAIAVVVLVMAVLPAEYGIDPLGTGKALGLTALSGAAEATPATPSAAATAPGSSAAGGDLKDDTFQVELRPFEGVEYKYRLEQGASLVYVWAATAKVNYDFHGEPDGAAPKTADSYDKGEAAVARGAFTAAKPGIHGWFWENPGATRITITLRTAGFYSASTEYRDGERIERKFTGR